MIKEVLYTFKMFFKNFIFIWKIHPVMMSLLFIWGLGFVLCYLFTNSLMRSLFWFLPNSDYDKMIEYFRK